MKCSAKLRRGGSCGQLAQWRVDGEPYCRLHATDRVFIRVLNDPAHMNPVKLKRLEE